MPADFLEALELIDWFRAATAGWRYLLSRSFRQAIHARWKNECPLRVIRVIRELLCGIAGIAFTLLLGYLMVSLFAGWDWPQRLVALTHPYPLATVPA